MIYWKGFRKEGKPESGRIFLPTFRVYWGRALMPVLQERKQERKKERTTIP